MKLTTTTQVSVDGVMQGNGGRHPDLDVGFERGGWARPLFDSEAMTFVDEVYQRADAFLFGRRTYELFAGYWGVREDLGNPIQEPSNGLIESQHELRLLTRVAYGIKGPEHLIPRSPRPWWLLTLPRWSANVVPDPHGRRREPEFSGHAGSAQGPHCSASEIAAAHNSA